MPLSAWRCAERLSLNEALAGWVLLRQLIERCRVEEDTGQPTEADAELGGLPRAVNLLRLFVRLVRRG